MERVLVGGAALVSVISLLTAGIAFPRLIADLTEVQERVTDTVNVFRVASDSSWEHIIDLQVSASAPSVRKNPFDSIFRQKRQANGLPAWEDPEPLDSQESKEHLDSPEEMPPSAPDRLEPPGQPGRPGAPGQRGQDGQPGAQGQPGDQGPSGAPGQPGRDGQPGAPGGPGMDGQPGKDAAYCPCPPRNGQYVAQQRRQVQRRFRQRS
ncbi:unnamed protein product, partial [Mesorhabditis spiculigera]